MQKLAILIPTIVGREAYFDKLMDVLTREKQWFPEKDIIIIPEKDAGYRFGGLSIGEKRNILIDKAVRAGATHRAFVDDDDMVMDNYFKLNMGGVYGNYDCNSLVGILTTNGIKDPNKHIFFHSLKYTSWHEDNQFFYRNPNHLNVVNLEKTKHIRFQHKNDGEDGCWSEDLAREGVLKNEFEITEPFYQYLFRSKNENGI